MSPEDRLRAFGERAGFRVGIRPGVVVAEGVPCLLANTKVGSCTIEKSFDPESGEPNGEIGGAVHVSRSTVDEEHDGRVYHADGSPVESYIAGDGKTWANISIRKGTRESPEDDASPCGRGPGIVSSAAPA